MTDLEKRIRELLPKPSTARDQMYFDDVIEALCKNAQIFYSDRPNTSLSYYRQDFHTYSSIVLDIQPLEQPDTPQKLIEDLAKCSSDEEAWELKDRAKRLVESEK